MTAVKALYTSMGLTLLNFFGTLREENNLRRDWLLNTLSFYVNL